MNDFLIETQIDKLIDLLSKKRKIPLSEAARVMNISQRQLEGWVSTLEDRGVVELKYPVLGEPEIALRGILPENLKIFPEAEKPKERAELKEEQKVEEIERKTESSYAKVSEENEIRSLEEKMTKLEKRVSEPTYAKAPEGEVKEIKSLEEKISNLEKKILEVTEEIDISKLKEEMFEILIIISSLSDIERIVYYLSFIEKIILVLKAKKAWDKVDKDLMLFTVRSIAENWKGAEKESISKLFEEMAKKIETI